MGRWGAVLHITGLLPVPRKRFQRLAAGAVWEGKSLPCLVEVVGVFLIHAAAGRAPVNNPVFISPQCVKSQRRHNTEKGRSELAVDTPKGKTKAGCRRAGLLDP